MTVFDNVAYGPRMAGLRHRGELDGLVEKCLRHAALWDEVKDRMDMLGTKLSGGQQQRLTLARALSLQPDILCLDEFSIAIDPVTTMKIEEVLLELRSQMTIVLVTNLVQQARRLASHTAFLNASRLVETGETKEIFTQPQHQITYDYVTGNIG
jgi:phosphate transport system ATP-binding protein